jgi:hypothetical protein
MKRTFLSLLVFCACVALSPAAKAQFGGMNPFKKPNISDIFHPVVGQGAVYEQQHKDGTKSPLELTVVGKETVDGKQGYWLEVGHAEKGSDSLTYAKLLVTLDPWETHKMIFVMPHSSQPVEYPMNPSQKSKEKMEENIEKWHKVGTESITVPAGTFLCDHWAKDDGTEDVWASSKVSPMSLVKSVGKNSTMVLMKTLSNAPEHITGTPQKFDPQMFRQQMMQEMQKNKNQQ